MRLTDFSLVYIGHDDDQPAVKLTPAFGHSNSGVTIDLGTRDITLVRNIDTGAIKIIVAEDSVANMAFEHEFLQSSYESERWTAEELLEAMYRLNPMAIDWTQVPEWVNYLTKNKDEGIIYGASAHPILENGELYPIHHGCYVTEKLRHVKGYFLFERLVKNKDNK